MGPLSEGFLSQTLTTVVGQSYNVSFWLALDTGTPNDFSCTFAGGSVLSLVNAAGFGYTQFSANITATSTTARARALRSGCANPASRTPRATQKRTTPETLTMAPP